MKGKWEILIPIKNVVDEGETSPVVGHVQLRSSECTAITVYDQTCSRPGRDTLAARPASAGSSGGGGSWSALGFGSFSVIHGSDQRFSVRS